MDRKQKQVERYLQGAKHAQSLDDRKALQRLAAERKASKQRAKRRRHWSDDDAAEDYEQLQRRERAAAARAGVLTSASATRRAVTHHGTVVGITAGRARVRTHAGDVEAVLAPELGATQRASLAVGDEASLTVRSDGSFVLVEVDARRSVLSRPDPSRPEIERVFAANVDVAVIVAAVVEPALRHRLIDRYLVALQRGGTEPLVAANKIDLVTEAEERTRLDRLLDDYRAVGVAALFTSAATGEGVEQLRDELASRTVVFVGQSGVGKSSLVQAVAPDLGLDVGRVRTGDGKGRHTTTGTTLFDVPLPRGAARLIDTPGVRSFSLAGVEPASVADAFPEFARYHCRFADCLHAEEPGCAVVHAVASGEVGERRYTSYRRILASLD
ncbi:MAG: ribosome small subunit-dependent GTPase A [Planctomycetota bacterium]